MSHNAKELHRTLGTKEVFAIASGAMISSGLFVLPAVTYINAGPSILAGYILASLFVIPTMLAKAELATAMPRSGGDYFFIDRSFGTMLGSFTGFAAWFSLSLKSAFALVGIGIFLEPLMPGGSPHMVKMIAVAFTLAFTVLNLFSVKESGRAQVIMVFMLLIVLASFTALGFPHVDLHHLQPFAPQGGRSIFKITGMIFISFGGLTKVASVAEEIKDPGRSIPTGMFRCLRRRFASLLSDHIYHPGCPYARGDGTDPHSPVQRGGGLSGTAGICNPRPGGHAGLRH